MEQTQDPVIEGLKARIRELQQKTIESMRVVNSMNKDRNEPPSYQDTELTHSEAKGSIAIKPDQYYGQKIHSAMREFLSQRKVAGLGPATLSEIYKALCDGGLKFETENEDNRKTNMRFLLRKNSSIFHRLPDKIHFALREWYPNIKADETDDDDKKPKKKKTKSKAKAVKIPSAASVGKDPPVPPKKDKAPEASLTQEEAVRAALVATDGEFKRQDIVDWIEEKHPAIHAGQKKQSIFAMLGKLKDEIETVKKGKGAEPSIYRRISSGKA
jgi:hypothetical protein